MRLSAGVELNLAVVVAQAYVYVEVTARIGYTSVNRDPFITFEEIAALVRLNGVLESLTYQLRLRFGFGALIKVCIPVINTCKTVFSLGPYSETIWDWEHHPKLFAPILDTSLNAVNKDALAPYLGGYSVSADASLALRPDSVIWDAEGTSINPNVKECSTKSTMTIPTSDLLSLALLS